MKASKREQFRKNALKFSRHGKSWSMLEDEALKLHWDLSQRAVVEALPQRSWIAIRTRARALGLPFGRPQGYESVSSAAARCGFTQGSFEKILSAMGVATFAGLTVKRHGKSKVRFVESEDATDATQRFLGLTTARCWFLSAKRTLSLSRAYRRIAEARIAPEIRIGSLGFYREEDLAKVDLRRRDKKRLRLKKKKLANPRRRQAEQTTYAAAA